MNFVPTALKIETKMLKQSSPKKLDSEMLAWILIQGERTWSITFEYCLLFLDI